MDVPNRVSATGAANHVTTTENAQGPALIDQVVRLTGLPENWVHEELDEILTTSGQPSEELTLDGLRAAMLAYLESLQETFESEAAFETLEVANETVGPENSADADAAFSPKSPLK